MEQEIRDEIYEKLKVLLAKVLEQVEEKAGVKVGRDEVARQEHISQGAGILYGKVLEEAKAIVKNYIVSAGARVEKFR